MDEFFIYVYDMEGVIIIVDLEVLSVIVNGKIYYFEIDDFCCYCLFNGLDNIGLIL